MEKSWHLFERNKELVLPDQIPRTTRTRKGRAGRLGQGCSNRYFRRTGIKANRDNRQSLGFAFRFLSSKKDYKNIFELFCFPNVAFPMHPIESPQ